MTASFLHYISLFLSVFFVTNKMRLPWGSSHDFWRSSDNLGVFSHKSLTSMVDINGDRQGVFMQDNTPL
jgi:hypothetical protein